jgi:flavin reductase (DIM6/NTAB) family NADH-FMN oxidoreductase RutF
MQPLPQNAASQEVRDEPTGVATALGRIPSGLFVVTWRTGDQDRAMLASWVMQAGFAPPAISIAVARSRDLLAAIEGASPFVVNVLDESQRPLLSRFGKPSAAGEDPFAGLATERTPCGAIALGAAAAWLECRAGRTSPAAADASAGGDHVVVLAEVVAGRGGERQPLVHLRRNGLRY